MVTVAEAELVLLSSKMDDEGMVAVTVSLARVGVSLLDFCCSIAT